MAVGDYVSLTDIEDILPGRPRVLFNLIDELRDDEVYTFIFDGNSQVLDHALVTRSLRRRAELDIVHVNVDFPRTFDTTVGSDHEPLLLRSPPGSGVRGAGREVRPWSEHHVQPGLRPPRAGPATSGWWTSSSPGPVPRGCPWPAGSSRSSRTPGRCSSTRASRT